MPDPYGSSDRRRPSRRWDHHAEVRDPWGGEPPRRGRNYFTLSQDRVDASTWASAVDHPFFIIFDLAMGGGFPDAFGGGPTASTVSGGQMKIDYLAVYNS